MERLQHIATSREARLIVRWGLRLVGPAVLVVLLVRVVDYGEFGDLLSDIRLPWLFGALAAVQLILFLRTMRWIEIHAAFGLPKASFAYQMRLSYATMLATLVLPQIVNPLSRLVLMAQDGYRAGRTLAGSVLEKLLEMGAFIVFGVYGSIVLASTFGGLAWWAIGGAVALGVAAFVAYLMRSRLTDLAIALIDRMPGLGGGQGDRDEIAHDIVSLDRFVLVRLSVWSLIIALTQAAMLYFLSRSLGVGLSFPYIVATWGVVALSLLLPLSVNGLGTREAVLVAAFRAAGESTDAAVAVGLLAFGVVAVGSLPGAFEWLRRFLRGSGQQASGLAPVAPPGAQAQGERSP
ncbi:MAG: lysylphosphatidylglycerol synthase transmembrane domain-containing protein [Dehalococcoidia bacterium]